MGAVPPTPDGAEGGLWGGGAGRTRVEEGCYGGPLALWVSRVQGCAQWGRGRLVYPKLPPPDFGFSRDGLGGGASEDLRNGTSRRGAGGRGQGCIRREGTAEAAPEAVRRAVGGGCRSGWGAVTARPPPLMHSWVPPPPPEVYGYSTIALWVQCLLRRMRLVCHGDDCHPCTQSPLSYGPAP